MSHRITDNLLSALALVLPAGISYLIGETLGALCFLLCGRRRQTLSKNLKTVAGHCGELFLVLLSLRVMVSFGRVVVQAFMVPHLSH